MIVGLIAGAILAWFIAREWKDDTQDNTHE